MEDQSRRLDMPPDPAMVDRGTQLALQCSSAINAFHQKMAWQLGRDGSHHSSHRALMDLAESLENTCKALRSTASDGEARAMNKFGK